MDFNSAIKPLVRFSRWFGLAPYSIHDTEHTTVYQHSKGAVVYCIVACLGIVGLMAAINSSVIGETKVYQSPVINVANVLVPIIGFTSHLYSHLMCFIDRDNMLNTIALMSTLVRGLDVNTSEVNKYHKFILAQQVMLLFVICAQFVIVTALYGMPLCKLYIYATLTAGIIDTLVPDLQFSNMTLVHGRLFKAFRLKLLKLGETFNDSDVTELHSMTRIVDTDNGMKIIGHREMLSVRSFVNRNEGSGDEDQVTKLMYAREIESFGSRVKCGDSFDAAKIHSSLFENTMKVTSMFRGQLLMSMCYIFLNLLITLFMLYHVNTQTNKEVDNYPLLAALIGIMVYSVIRLFLIVVACSYASYQAEALGRTVSRLQSNAKTTPFRDQMQALSLQILHHKVQFSACGLFPIDATLVTSIFGGVATYLVIVIQMSTPTSSSEPISTPPSN